MSRPDDPTQRDPVFRRDTEIGPYRLLELLGTGAMGEVWRAEQREPIRRIVALKLIKKGMDTREVITRFEIERQALALMEHPGIAAVYDAGEAGDGRPFIAMEYVAGEKITEYCASHRLSIDDRLRLVQRVCAAVQHAHQKAVIHRDLKPSNILVIEVDGEPQPKIIDFGIAKATAQRLTDRSAATFVGQLIGTPLYMSPEQVAMTAAGVDTRADVYSLGVILYELLSGALPHDPEQLAKAGLDEVLRVLRESDAPRPSARVSTLGDRTSEIAAQRGLDPKKLTGRLRGDLDWIALKALEKDLKRRYESPKDLANDIERFLEFDPVEARPPSTAYRVARFVRRHRVGTAVAAVALLTIVTFAVWQSVQATVIARERDRAVAFELLSYARATLEDDPTSATAYAISSLEAQDLPETRELIHRALAHGPPRTKFERTPSMGRNALAVDTSPDGRYFAVAWGGTKHGLVLHDLHNGTWRLLDLENEEGSESAETLWAWDVAFNADGTIVAGLGEPGVVAWRVADGREISRLDRDGPSPAAIQTLYPQDHPGHLLVSGHRPEQGTIWYDFDLESGQIDSLGTTPGEDSDRDSMHFPGVSPDREWFADFADERVFMQSREALGTREFVHVGSHPALVTSATFDPQSELLATSDQEGHVYLWDITARPPRRIEEHSLDPDGNRIQVTFDRHRPRFLTSWNESEVTVFDYTRSVPRRPRRLLDRTHWTHAGAFLPDGSVITARNGGLGTTHFPVDPWIDWSIALRTPYGTAVYAAITPDGQETVLWTEPGVIVSYPIRPDLGSEVRVVEGSDPINRGAGHSWMVDAERNRFLLVQDGPPRVFQLDGAIYTLTCLPSPTVAIALSSDGRRVAGTTTPVRQFSRDRSRPIPLLITDVDTDQITHEFDILLGGSEDPQRANYVDTPTFIDGTVLALEDHHYIAWHLQPDGSARADTLWSSDHAVYGKVVDDGRALVVAREDDLLFVDLTKGSVQRIADAPKRGFRWADLSPSRKLVAIGVRRNTVVLVYDLDTGTYWRLPGTGPVPLVNGFDPLGRWLFINGSAWSLPLDPIFSDRPRDDLVKSLRSMTNLRAVRDTTGTQRYVLRAGPPPRSRLGGR